MPHFVDVDTSDINARTDRVTRLTNRDLSKTGMKPGVCANEDAVVGVSDESLWTPPSTITPPTISIPTCA